jgi:signal transduction histidine kinase
MSPLRNVPIRQKLILIIMTTLSLSLVVAAMILYVWDYRAYRQYVTRDVGTTATVIADNVKAAVAFKDPAAAGETLSSLRAKPEIASACVYDESGQLFATYYRGVPAAICTQKLRPDGDYVESGGLMLFRPIAVQGRRVGTVSLRRTFDDVNRQMRLQSGVLIAILAVALLVGLILSDRLQRVVSAPIGGLARTARAVTRERDYSLRADRYGSDELGTLVDAFNDMLAQMQQRTSELQATKGQLERTVLELQEANRLKDEFLATLSHELRTPLNAILGWARMLGTDVLDDERRKRACETIERNAVAQARIVDDLLDISRIVTGKLRLELRPVGLSTVVAAALDVVRPSADARQVRLVSDTADVDPDTVLGDPDRLQQMIWNLLTNAIKFTDAGGEVRIQLTNSDTLELRITDNGRGMDPAFVPYAFDLFRQADASSTREHGGLGLGLALARRIVELHGGTIRIESPGLQRGTTVTVMLPAFNGKQAYV